MGESKAEFGSVAWYQDGLYKHIAGCNQCNPPYVDGYCKDGKSIVAGLSSARGREAGATGAML